MLWLKKNKNKIEIIVQSKKLNRVYNDYVIQLRTFI